MDQAASVEETSADRSLQRKLRRSHLADQLFARTTWLFAVLVLVIVLAITLSLVIGAWPILRQFGFSFLTSAEWNPVTDTYGALVPMVGTLVTSAIAIIIAVPVSFGIAVFITELAPRWLQRPIGTAVELLAAIPSIIYGMWGLFVFAPLFAQYVQPWIIEHIGSLPLIGFLFSGPPLGIGLFTAGLILAIMVIPFITAVFRDIFELVPAVLKESAYGLGATTWEVVRNVVLPYTKVGVAGGIMLGLGRALGETMAVTFVIGNAYQLNRSLFMPGTTISATLANEFTEATGDLYVSALLALGLVLFCITFLVLALAKLLMLRLTAMEGERT
ncbi:MAG: phosphate ABC transporter permease subunit PstC [Nitrococcus sp.]|nr:phosphate ABC transporter permease subunit PstC [Nitrococcus sp.]